MKNSTASDLIERSLPFYRVLRMLIALAFFASAVFCIVGELAKSDFDRSYHWIWIGAVGAFLLSYILQWTVEGEAQRYKELGDD